ncbi:MAG TPA: hypothetical protein PKU91_02805, partial [Phycisphaerales bacterium]|nr:hypothetical protein [Phycisphaerales bacterium]
DDPRPPRVTSGVRLGTPAVTSRGLKEAHMPVVADFIDRVLDAGLRGDDDRRIVAGQVREQVRSLCREFPMPA